MSQLPRHNAHIFIHSLLFISLNQISWMQCYIFFCSFHAFVAICIVHCILLHNEKIKIKIKQVHGIALDKTAEHITFLKKSIYTQFFFFCCCCYCCSKSFVNLIILLQAYPAFSFEKCRRFFFF